MIWPVISQAITLEAYAKNPDGYILFIRHALAPGTGDPSHFRLQDCQTQRNLSQQGVEQAKELGAQLSQAGLKIADIFTSQWCRCKDTAKYAFGDYKEFTALNSTFQSPYNKNERKQLKELYSFVKKWNGNGKNLILITHYSIITATTTAVPSSGEIVIVDKNFKVLGTIQTH